MAKILEFSFSISPSNEYSGLISFRIDWFDFLAAQETLKSLLQHRICLQFNLGSIPESGSSPWGGNGNPFQYSCLGNPMNTLRILRTQMLCLMGEQRNQKSNCQHLLDHQKTKRVSEKHPLLLYWLCQQSLWLCGSRQTVENSSRDGNTRPPDLPPEKSICSSRSNS